LSEYKDIHATYVRKEIEAYTEPYEKRSRAFREARSERKKRMQEFNEKNPL